jgi:hypothetical protein
MSKDATIHRPFHLTTPIERGPDVKALQHALNKVAGNLPKLTHFKLKEDGQFGRHTFHAAHRAAFLLGLTDGRLQEITRRHTINQDVQTNLRHPSERAKSQVNRAHHRQEAERKRLEKHGKGAGAAVKYARDHLGVTENPPGSNGGGPIDTWEQFWGLGHVFWCGCFAGYCVKAVGKANVDSWLPYSGSIDADARADTRGLHAVPVSEAQAGDLVTFRFEGSVSDHIGLCVGPTVDGLVHTIDGNTSAANGSQSNGGGVFEKKRPTSYVVTVARPDYS